MKRFKKSIPFIVLFIFVVLCYKWCTIIDAQRDKERSDFKQHCSKACVTNVKGSTASRVVFPAHSEQECWCIIPEKGSVRTW